MQSLDEAYLDQVRGMNPVMLQQMLKEALRDPDMTAALEAQGIKPNRKTRRMAARKMKGHLENPSKKRG